MGSSLSSLFWKLFHDQQEVQVMMLGLDAAGKTTMLYRMKEDIVFMTTPTIGFNVENIVYKNMNLTIWDVGGQEKIRSLWRKCWKVTDALIYVIDLTDRERIHEAAYELRRVLEEDNMRDAVLLVFANKVDKYNRMTVDEVMKVLRLSSLHRRKWHIQECSAKTGDGLQSGLHWLRAQLRKHR
jgi:small GTP-binding protein